MKATTTTSGAARKKVKKGTLKSPFELSQGQKKLASTSSKASVRSTKEVGERHRQTHVSILGLVWVED